MQDRFERFVVSITELHRYLQKLKELEMGQLDLKAGYTMCLYHLGKHPEGLTATQLTELCKEDKAAISRTLSQLSAKGLVSCELPENKRSYRTLYYLTEEGSTVVKKNRFPDLLCTGSRRRRHDRGTAGESLRFPGEDLP